MNHSIQNPSIVSDMIDSQRLQTLYMVNNMLKQIEADGLNIYVILPRVVNLAVKQLNAQEGSILVVNEDLIAVEYAWSTKNSIDNTASDEFLGTIMSGGVAGKVIRVQEPILIHDTLTDPLWIKRPAKAKTETSSSVICTPFMIRQKAIGAITIQSSGTNQFDDGDLELLMAISDQAASSIHNARLFEASQRQLKISALLNEASRAINSSLDVNEIMQSLLAQMNDFLNAEALSIALVDEKTQELVYQVAEGAGSDEIVGLRLPSNQGLSGWVMTQGKPALVRDTSSDPRFTVSGDKRTGHATRAMICAPMQFKGEVLGTIQAINPIEGTFTQEDLDLLINLANIASTALANAQQFSRTQAAESRYTSLFHDTVDPIILTDMDGRIVEVNRCATSFWEYNRHEMLSMNLEQLHPSSVEFPKLRNLRTNTVRVFVSETLTKSNVPIPVEVYAKRILYGNSELLQWIHHDISKQVELEEMRSDLTAMLFHDLQSPLGNVISSLELLAYEIPTDDDTPMSAMLDIAKRSSRRLQTLIRSLLDISRLEAGNPIGAQKNVNLYDLIDEVKEIERPNFEQRRVTLKYDLAPDIPYIYVEEDMIRRVLINLLSNALKYSHDSKLITISAEKQLDTNMVHMSVSDKGVGIPPKYRDLIFEKFERIKHGDSSSKGLGLGLAFCRLAIEAHVGQIWVDDAPGGGARFNFTLPISPEEKPVKVLG
ncbi:MAG: GAF domain-containing protein [Chloroflexi bacterium]|nr:GAF domain-containing protein [Chloroflexota bacterium]